MNAQPCEIPGVLIFEPAVHVDERGHFLETFNATKFAELVGESPNFVQDNQSQSKFGVLRGLHCQREPRAQAKLLRVTEGEIFDVVVDLRRGSPSYARWMGTRLSSTDHRQIWIPPGLAHGFVTLSEMAIVQYKVSDYWSPEHEFCIAWNDPRLAIDWPTTGTPLVSPKDQAGLSFDEFEADNR